MDKGKKICNQPLSIKNLMSALGILTNSIPAIHVQVFLDNTTVVAYINGQGSTKSRALQTLAEKILLWAESHLASLSAVHIKSTLNLVAHFLQAVGVLVTISQRGVLKIPGCMIM